MANYLLSSMSTAKVRPRQGVNFTSEGNNKGLWHVHAGINWIFGMSGVRSHCGPTGGTTLRAQMAWCGWWTAQTDWGWKTVGRSSVPCCWRRYDRTTINGKSDGNKCQMRWSYMHGFSLVHICTSWQQVHYLVAVCMYGVYISMCVNDNWIC